MDNCHDSICASLIETTPVCFIVTDRSHKILFANASTCRLFGYSREELIGENIGYFIDSYEKESNGDGTLPTDNNVKASQTTRERYGLHKCGKKIPLEVILTPIIQDDQQLNSIIARDITEEKHYETTLRKQSFEAQLIHQASQIAEEATSFEESLQRCIDIVCDLARWPIGHVYLPCQHDSRLLAPTNLWHLPDSHTHVRFREVTEQTTFEAGIGLPGRIRSSGKPAWITNVIKDKNFPRNKLCHELNVKGAFGFPILIGDETVAVLEFFTEEEVHPDQQMLQTVYDVGIQVGRVLERKRAAEALRAARDAAEVANRTKSEFLANMSHEIRTPMNAILGFTEILSDSITDPLHKKYLSSIQSSGKSLLSLINDILDLSKVEAGKLDLEYHSVNPWKIFQDMKQIFSHTIKEKGLDMFVTIDPNLPKALVLDETRLRQVLLNLIGNGVKFTDSGHIELSVKNIYPEIDRSKLDLIFSIKDTGIGIPADQVCSIFAAFEQQDGQSNAKYGGTGLGLTITRRLVEMMKGEITVTSSVGAGSTFDVVLHGVAVGSMLDQEDDNEDINDLISIKFESATVLIADDIEANRDLVRGFLASYNFKFIEVRNGREAYDKARMLHPDLILMDMKMPVMNGYDATMIIKNDEVTKNIPVVALTASAMKQTEHEIRSRCDGYLRKPISKYDLIKELANHLSCTHSMTSQKSTNEESKKTANGIEPVMTMAETNHQNEELIKSLEEQRPVWEDLSQTPIINKVEEFGEHIKNIGSKYSNHSVMSWGERLKNQAALFEIDALSHTMEKFPRLLDEISLTDKSK